MLSDVINEVEDKITQALDHYTREPFCKVYNAEIIGDVNEILERLKQLRIKLDTLPDDFRA